MARPQLAFRPRASAESLEIDIYDEIGESWDGEGVTAKGIRDLLKAQAPRAIRLRINSIGGSVADGVAIHNILREQAEKGVPVECRIDGMAASSASVIVAACDKVTIPANAVVMIHNPWTMAAGDADAFEQAARMLRQWNGVFADTYVAAAARRGVTKTREECLAAMAEETWLFGDEAVAFGLADKCDEPMKAAASLDLSMFRRAQEMAARFNAAPRAEIQKDHHMSDRLIKALGAQDEASALAIVEQVTTELATVRASLPQVEARAAALAALETEVGASGEAAVGVVKALRAKAEQAEAISAELAEARAKLVELAEASAKAEHAALVAAALDDGSLAPAMKSWADSISTDTLRAYLAVAPKAIPGAGAPTPRQPAVASAPSLTDDDKAVAERLGITLEAFAQAKASKTTHSTSDSDEEN